MADGNESWKNKDEEEEDDEIDESVGYPTHLRIPSI